VCGSTGLNMVRPWAIQGPGSGTVSITAGFSSERLGRDAGKAVASGALESTQLYVRRHLDETTHLFEVPLSHLANPQGSAPSVHPGKIVPDGQILPNRADRDRRLWFA
jgi:hypothetical protein